MRSYQMLYKAQDSIVGATKIILVILVQHRSHDSLVYRSHEATRTAPKHICLFYINSKEFLVIEVAEKIFKYLLF